MKIYHGQKFNKSQLIMTLDDTLKRSEMFDAVNNYITNKIGFQNYYYRVSVKDNIETVDYGDMCNYIFIEK